VKFFFKFFLKNLAATKKYLHLCITKNRKQQMLPIQKHIENAGWFSCARDYTICGAATAVE